MKTSRGRKGGRFSTNCNNSATKNLFWETERSQWMRIAKDRIEWKRRSRGEVYICSSSSNLMYFGILICHNFESSDSLIVQLIFSVILIIRSLCISDNKRHLGLNLDPLVHPLLNVAITGTFFGKEHRLHLHYVFGMQCVLHQIFFSRNICPWLFVSHVIINNHPLHYPDDCP